MSPQEINVTSATPPTSPRPPMRPEPKPGEPYCSNCGYVLTGATETTVCPECGKPLVDVLVRGRVAWGSKARRYRSEATLFGVPVIDVALGIDEEGRRGRAKGIIAIGDIATGGIAIANSWAVGVVAFGGGGATGVCALGGGCSIGLLTALGGGVGLGGLALGGVGAGGIASGGVALGFIAQGGVAIGCYARGGSVIGVYTFGPNPATRSQRAMDMFQRLEGIIGSPNSQLSMMKPIFLIGGIDITVAAAVLVVALYGHRRATRRGAGGVGGRPA